MTTESSLSAPKHVGAVDTAITFICLFLFGISIVLIGIAMNGHPRATNPLLTASIGGCAFCGLFLMALSQTKPESRIWRTALAQVVNWLKAIEQVRSETSAVPVKSIRDFIFTKIAVPLACLLIAVSPLIGTILAVFVAGSAFGFFIKLVLFVLGLIA